MFNNDISRKDHADTVVQIDIESELNEKSGSDAGQPRKRLLDNLNPAKAVIVGISQSTNAVKGGLSHSRWISTIYAFSFSQSLPPLTKPCFLLNGQKNTVENGLNNVGGKLTKVPGVSQGVSIFADYRKFLDRGSVIDLAIAVVIGTVLSLLLSHHGENPYFLHYLN